MILDEIVEKRKINIAKQKTDKIISYAKTRSRSFAPKIEIFLWKKH